MRVMQLVIVVVGVIGEHTGAAPQVGMVPVWLTVIAIELVSIHETLKRTGRIP